MPQTWVVSDTHFGHANIIEYCRKNMPWKSAAEMDEDLISRWNEIVDPKDRVYHLGDVCINRKHLPTIGRCNGRKVLIKGNHDLWKLKYYEPYFDDIRSYQVYPQHGLIMSHVPVALHELLGRFGVNAHGHTHANVIKAYVNGEWGENPLYLNVCVEMTGYRPIPIEQVFTYAKTIRACDPFTVALHAQVGQKILENDS